MKCSFGFMKDSLRLPVFHRRNIGEQFSSQASGWSSWADEAFSIPLEDYYDAFVSSKNVLLTAILTKYVDIMHGYRIISEMDVN